ncbi:MAG: Gfo/Idh/MocA family oxidoreductase [Candidatus Thorarchaeota archaeon]|nr:Gfo/Idh/MocA family oxidoreductase [Candidatus Thorarchaeota archaeon]
MKPVELVIVGAGDRGFVYAAYAKLHPDRARIVGVAEPREYYRTKMVEDHNIPQENVFTDWKDLAKKPKIADAVIIATRDHMHKDTAIAFAKKDYHILLEKPMAPDEKSCKDITKAVVSQKIIFAVGHVLRYTRYTQELKSIIDSGLIGDVISIQHLEPVGYWHQAHSFVRGNWRNEKESAFMLLTKSCHDIDWIRYIVGKKCKTISSFGSLTHFKKENKPSIAGDNCLDCDYEPQCPYSAKHIYLNLVKHGKLGWPVSVVTPDVTVAGVIKALREGQYGRCVYECDNDVVDHQIVNLEFEDGETASFTMTAFTKARPRETRIFGTRGEIYGNGTKIQVFEFLTGRSEIVDLSQDEKPEALSDHGGGDYGLIHAFVTAVSENDATKILSGPEETLESHLMTFAAERSRIERKVIDVKI